jgi:hypothetical protein
MSRTIVRISTAGLVSLMSLAISAANAHEAGAQVIGTVYSYRFIKMAQVIGSVY